MGREHLLSRDTPDPSPLLAGALGESWRRLADAWRGRFQVPGWACCPLSTFPPQICPEPKKQLGSHAWYIPKNTSSFRNCGSTAGPGQVGAQWGGGRWQVGGVGAAVPDPTLGSVWLALAAALGSASVLCLPPLLLLAPSPLPHCSGLFPRLFSSAPARGSPICWGPACRARSSPGTPAAGLSAELSFPSCHPALPTLGPRLPRCGGQGTVG